MNTEARKVIADAISAVLETSAPSGVQLMEILVEEIIHRDAMDPDEQTRFRREIEW